MIKHKKIIFELNYLNEFPMYNVKVLVHKNTSGKHSTYTVSINEGIDIAFDSLNELRDSLENKGFSWTVYYMKRENLLDEYKLLEVAESSSKKISEQTKFDLMKTKNKQLIRLVEQLELKIEESPF
jgi:thymidylate synthase ThyX